MKRFVSLVLLFIFLFGFPGTVQGQNGTEFSKVIINIWPEYDRPGVLVFYQITLAPQTSLPATMTIRIPRAVKEPFNVAMKDIDGRLDNLRYTTTLDGEWVKIAFTTPVPEVQFEYYDPVILVNGDSHRYRFLWPGDYSIKSLVLNIQQPLESQNFSIEPAMGTGQINQDGLTYYESVVGEVKSGVEFHITLEYDKTGTSLSAPSQSVAAVETITTSTAGWQTLYEVLPYVLSGLGLFLILAGGYWYWRSGKAITTAFRKRYSMMRSREADAEPSEVFCHSCGRKAVSGDVYCRSCGTKLRSE